MTDFSKNAQFIENSSKIFKCNKNKLTNAQAHTLLRVLMRAYMCLLACVCVSLASKVALGEKPPDIESDGKC